ncbi:MAG: histidinol phosphate phosphatase domain-containing protein [Candidatus Verstraetearchaeota archaeon]|nr:histidinol phosphate phosphatase domain-containing protein [Candidatus Verstraetearchaeota archaeon]
MPLPSRRICDFHMHSLISDGELLPAEIVRRTYVLGHRAVAITDHTDPSNMQHVISSLVRASEFISKYYSDFQLIPGVELTHVPPKSIPSLAREAKRYGAKIVVVHGESPVEPVQEGTDGAACSCSDVDLIAHPGYISREAVERARENGIFLELTSRGGHCLGNGHVARLARRIGAHLVVDSDAHDIGDLLTPKIAMGVAHSSGLTKAEAERVVYDNPSLVMKRLNL